MSALKVIAIVLLSLFLALSLTVFSWLFSIKMTALNANYVTSQLDDLPVTALVEEAEFDEVIEEYPELGDLIKSSIIENEAELKERTGEIINTVYDYLKGRNPNLDLAATLSDTVLDPDFSISIVEKADLTPLIKELLNDMMSEVELPYGLSIEPYLDDIALELEPWVKQQAAIAIPPIYDYILGQSQNTNLIISLAPATENLKNALRQDFLESVPPEFAGLSTAELEQEFDEIFDDFADDIRPNIDIDLELMGSDIPSDVSGSLADVEEAFEESRRYIGYFNTVYGLLIGFILLLIVGIALVYRQVKGSTRTLGSIFLSYGAINLIAVFIARGIAGSQITQLDDVPLSIRTWLTQFITSSLTPLLVLSIVLLVIGAALLTVSFIYQRRQTPTATETPL